MTTRKKMSWLLAFIYLVALFWLMLVDENSIGALCLGAGFAFGSLVTTLGD